MLAWVHPLVLFSAARHLTFILMMSVTQLTCASLVSQQKCLRRENPGVSDSFPPRYFPTHLSQVTARGDSQRWTFVLLKGQFTDYFK